MNVVLREARPSDADQLAALRYEFRSSLRSAAEARAAFLPRCADWMRVRLSASLWHCWVAERAGTIVGNLWCSMIEKVPNPVGESELHAYITNFYVQPECRGGGIGESLLQSALEWCRGQGVDAVILWPTERSRSLYLRHGFALRADLLQLVLSDSRVSS
jgi:GNAT superfamily N-acetyltransferase